MSDDDPVTITTSERELAAVRDLAAREQQTLQQRAADTEDIVKSGHREFGSQKFDEGSQSLANAFGGNIPPATLDALRSAQMPHRELMELIDDPQRLERFVKMSPEGQRAELSSRENQRTSFGRVIVGAEPAYKNKSLQKGELSDADLNAGLMDRMSDKDAFKEIDRRIAARCEKRGGRW